jgi:RNA polymerase sigma-70 factor (ECF subfamily)
MSAPREDASLEVLLDKLGQGDVAAAEQVFVRYEPYLRMLVRRQLSARLRAKFDSIDVVQSVWADLLHNFRESGWRFTDAAHLRAFLVKVTRNRFIDRIRQHKRALEREQPLNNTPGEQLPASPQPQPSELAQADDLWTQLLALCPPAHRELLLLKRQGCSLAELAARTGLHESSVRRILYDLARRLAIRQQGTATHGTDS